jgi:hypothetical protein
MLLDLGVPHLGPDRFQRNARARLVRPISREYPATSAAKIAARRRLEAIAKLSRTG